MRVVVVGGSVAGLATGIALGQQGHRVTILEQDATPLPETALEAFEKWERRGAPQTRHSHAFLARLHNLLRDRVPGLLEALLASGAELMRFEDMVRPTFGDGVAVPADEDLTMLACRRLTFEWVMRRWALAEGLVEFRDGETVEGLLAERSASGGAAALPCVRGVRLAGGETLGADLVVDASGRRTRIGRWLAAVGAREMRVESEPCGIFYSSRFYRLRQAAPLSADGVIAADLGYLKYALFRGDSGIFSITLAASPDDDPLRSVLKERCFEAAATALPSIAPWVDPGVSEPVTDVHAMANLRDTRRFWLEDGAPLALGVCSVGDALIHTNPIVGRGCTLAWVNATLLADALRDHPDDLHAFALALDAAVEREIVPWYEAMRMQDRDSIEVSRAQLRGEDPFALQRPDGSVDPKATMRSLLREGLVPALAEDIEICRAFMRLFNLLEAPSDLMRRPDILQRVLAVWSRRGEREPRSLGPTRAQMIETLRAAA
jgi:2-polyprenyl-6-methoxyphenol hydroxylase-like FAD-dependent oxidoreductase